MSDKIEREAIPKAGRRTSEHIDSPSSGTKGEFSGVNWLYPTKQTMYPIRPIIQLCFFPKIPHSLYHRPMAGILITALIMPIKGNLSASPR